MSANTTRRVVSLSTIVLTLLVCISTAGVTVLVGLVAYWSQPTLTFSEKIYQPLSEFVCPGAPLTYTPTIHVARLPAMPSLARTWWSRDEQRTVLPDPQVDTLIWTENTPRLISSQTSVLVPGLPAGRYEMRVAVRAATVATYAVPFTVPAGCSP